jgi:hypothetical protein
LTLAAADHCTAHVIDVTMNMVAIMEKIGLADNSGLFSGLKPEDSAILFLGGLLAAAIHE